MTEALLHWFEAHKRDLPWRQDRSPYRVWIAEIMLQQTQVATVIPYFKRWLERFPNAATLAQAPLDEVLKLWEGLGYYRRARLLHEAANRVLKDYGGTLPERYDDLLMLPGIGPYTAAAIASLAFGERVLAVDGNVKRVAARLFMLPGAVSEKTVKEKLEPHLPTDEPGSFNEALMELGATVCTPTSPRCSVCPLAGYCQAFQNNRVADFPQPKPKKPVPQLERYALVCLSEQGIYLRQRGADEMLGGLWGFPLSESSPAGRMLPSVKHAYTHFKITTTPLLVATTAHCDETGRFVATDELAKLALSKLDHKILQVLRSSNLL